MAVAVWQRSCSCLAASVKCNLFSVYLAWFGLVVVIKVRTVPRAQKDALPITVELILKTT